MNSITLALLLLTSLTFCHGAPSIFKSRKELSDWFKVMFDSQVRLMEEDRAADEMACEYGSYWSGESCENCEDVCRDLKSTLCVKVCPVYAAETIATMNYEKFSQQFVTSEDEDNYKLYFYILSGLIGLLYVLVVVKFVMFVYKKCVGPVWKRLMSMLQTKQLKRKETNDKDLKNKEANVAANVKENLLIDQKKDEIAISIDQGENGQHEPTPDNALTAENGPNPENGPIHENGPIPENGPIHENGPIPENCPIPENGPIAENLPIPENEPTPENGPSSGSRYFTENESLSGNVSAPVQETGN